MGNFWKYLMVEWKLLFRGPVFWVITLICGGVLYLFSSIENFADSRGMYAMHQSQFLMIVFLFTLLLAMHLARRETLTRSNLILHALPSRYLQLQAMKIVALAAPMSIIAAIPAIFFAINVILIDGTPISDALYGILILLTSVIPVWFIAVVGYIVGLLSSKRWIYIAGLALFLSMTYLLQFLISKWFPQNWIMLLEFSQVDLFRTELYSRQWGFMHGTTFWLHRLFYLSLLITAFLVLVILGMKRRYERQGLRNIYFAAIFSSLLAIITAYLYMNISMDRLAIIKTELDFYKSTYEITYYSKDGQEIVTDNKKRELATIAEYAGIAATKYDLTLHVEKKHGLTIEAAIHMNNGTNRVLDRFPVTLRHIYDLSSVVVNGEAATYEWETNRDFVWVVPAQPLPIGEKAVINMTYNGTVNSWRYDHDSGFGLYYRNAFVDDDRLYLPGTSGWFPIPGTHSLTQYVLSYYNNRGGPKPNLVDSLFAIPNADYNVKIISAKTLNVVPVVGAIVRSDNDRGVYQTELSAKQAPGFSVIAGPLKLLSYPGTSHSISILVDGWYVGRSEEETVGKWTMFTEQVLQLLTELWPEGSGNEARKSSNKLEDFPASLTLLLEYRSPTSINRRINIADPAIINANGLVYAADYSKTMPRLDPHMKTRWLQTLFEQQLGEIAFQSSEFNYLLVAYLTASTDTEHKAQLLPMKDPVIYSISSKYNQEFNQIYKQSTEAEFKHFIKAYYEMLMGISVTGTNWKYEQVIDAERKFIQQWAERGQ
ncbi:ABC transporter permease [Cohnella abietis]|uniref:Uncharacterized protein n=1 Tax=Cohnella abietis TaxID=2507935 RepID=A0A3T1DAU0_9BACL|nr:hypothetical protein [Cohnella abietis]BBI35189.1 hypothetical protein KCTCHS21_45880 [Cohnella abietis]